MKMYIGDKVKYKNEYGEIVCATIMEISSDMDSYDKMKLNNGVPHYYSKKLSNFVPVKKKNIGSVYLTVENNIGKTEYIFMKNVI
jgi:hypothetical protein|tara:strand:- start:1534 stop:1788 length:255 start_codon:yes stop_codon:yes gene_type:complete